MSYVYVQNAPLVTIWTCPARLRRSNRIARANCRNIIFLCVVLGIGINFLGQVLLVFEVRVAKSHGKANEWHEEIYTRSVMGEEVLRLSIRIDDSCPFGWARGVWYDGIKRRGVCLGCHFRVIHDSSVKSGESASI